MIAQNPTEKVVVKKIKEKVRANEALLPEEIEIHSLKAKAKEMEKIPNAAHVGNQVTKQRIVDKMNHLVKCITRKIAIFPTVRNGMFPYVDFGKKKVAIKEMHVCSCTESVTGSQ